MQTKYIITLVGLIFSVTLLKSGGSLHLNKNSNSTLVKKAQASLLGTTIGDRFGYWFENPMNDSKKPEVFNIKRLGRPSDDTACSLALATNLLKKKGKFNPKEYARQLIEWKNNGHYDERGSACFGGGGNMRKMVDNMDRDLPNLKKTYDPYINNGLGNLGNGALMKMGPAVLAHTKHFGSALDSTLNVMNLTHQHPEAKIINELATDIIFFGLNNLGTYKDALAYTARLIYNTQDCKVHNEIAKAINHATQGTETSYGKPTHDGGRPTFMHAVQTFKAVVFGLFKANQLDNDGELKKGYPADWTNKQRIAVRTIQETIYLGGDTDTTAAIAGMIVGAMLGDDCWPEEFTRQIKWKDEILLAAKMLVEKDYDADKIEKLEAVFCHKNAFTPIKFAKNNPGTSLAGGLALGSATLAAGTVIHCAQKSNKKTFILKLKDGWKDFKKATKKQLQRLFSRIKSQRK